MPRYFFDVHDKDGVSRDEVGLELPDMPTAVSEARRALADMTREALVENASDGLHILIRDGLEGPVRLAVRLQTLYPPESEQD
jgi:hypothetical protein